MRRLIRSVISRILHSRSSTPSTLPTQQNPPTNLYSASAIAYIPTEGDDGKDESTSSINDPTIVAVGIPGQPTVESHNYNKSNSNKDDRNEIHHFKSTTIADSIQTGLNSIGKQLLKIPVRTSELVSSTMMASITPIHSNHHASFSDDQVKPMLHHSTNQQREQQQNTNHNDEVFNQYKKSLGLTSTSFDRGIFQTLPNDGTTNQMLTGGGNPQHRAGFDRLIQVQLNPDLWLFGVIDGHGISSLCAEYLYEAFPIVIQLLINNKERSVSDENKSSSEDEDAFYLDVLKESFRVCAQEWDRSSPKSAAIDHDRRHSGAVALMVLVKDHKCYVANAGDCRGVISDGNGLFRDVHGLHRTDNPEERARVLGKGGKIKQVHGILRVQGALMPTRAFGDISVRTDYLGNLQDFVNPEPDISLVHPEPNHNGKSYLLLGSDGLWDALPDKEIARTVNIGLEENKKAEEIAHILGMAAAANIRDDVSVVLLVW